MLEILIDEIGLIAMERASLDNAQCQTLPYSTVLTTLGKVGIVACLRYSYSFPGNTYGLQWHPRADCCENEGAVANNQQSRQVYLSTLMGRKCTPETQDAGDWRSLLLGITHKKVTRRKVCVDEQDVRHLCRIYTWHLLARCKVWHLLWHTVKRLLEIFKMH